MARFIWHGGDWVPAERFRAPVASGAAIHRDFADYTKCHADGQMYGTRRDFDRAVERAGCVALTPSEFRAQRERGPREYRECGPPVKHAIKEALGRLGHL